MMPALLRRHPSAEKLARQLLALYPLSARLGAEFWHWYAFLQTSESWTVAQLQDHQFDVLRNLLQRLATTSPYFQEQLSGVRIESITNLTAFQQAIPAMSRQTFAANLDRIRCRDFAHRAVRPASTSGTTGHALQFFHPRKNTGREWAAICHQWRRVGYDPVRSGRAEFRGLPRHGALFQEFPEQNMVRFSILDLRAEVLPRMAEAITERRLRFFHGYPSALYLLANEVLRGGIRFPAPEAILLASEMVHDFQLERIQEAFPSSRLFAHYGCAEATVLGAWCEHRRAYHVLPQYALVEVDAAGGEIIGTNLYNDVNGFVRYRMTDAAKGAEQVPCPACRRPYVPVLTGLDGRREDYLYSRAKGWVAPAIVTYPLKHLHVIQELQFHQRDPDRIAMHYVTRADAQPETVAAECADIERGLRTLLGSEIGLDAVRVDTIPRGPTGKYKWIVSTLDPRAGTP